MAPQVPTQTPVIYQLKITLKHSRPPIWRRVQVRSDTTLGALHRVIQRSMGWNDSHLHTFTIKGNDYGQPDPYMEMRDERSVEMRSLVSGESFKFSYLYDYGDNWEHEVLVENVLQADPAIKYPICIKAQRACPPEDCGGVWGYQGFLEAIQDKSHPEHEEQLEWAGGSFDPESTNLAEINIRLGDM